MEAAAVPADPAAEAVEPAGVAPGRQAASRSVCLVMALGCPRSEVDTAHIYEYVRANGWALADAIEEADVVIVMTCGYCADFEERSIALLRSVDRRRRPGSRLIVSGCLAGISEERLSHQFNALLVPPRRIEELDAALGASVPFRQVQDPGELGPYIETTSRYFSETDLHPGDTWLMRQARSVSCRTGVRKWVLRNRGHGDKTCEASARVFSIRVAAGCMGECTYCAIRFAAGPLHSKQLAAVLEEFDTGLAGGYGEFQLIAGDLGCYGQDIGISIADLLEALLTRPGDYLLSLTDFDLKYLIMYRDRLIDVLTTHAQRFRSIEIPVQSGSQRILSRMGRGHTAAEAEQTLRALRAACPTMSFRSHAMVGFPGETEADFQDTLRLLRVGRFNYVTFYDYTDRPGTEAAAMTGKVPRSVIRKRSIRAHREFCGSLDALRYRAKAWGLR